MDSKKPSQVFVFAFVFVFTMILSSHILKLVLKKKKWKDVSCKVFWLYGGNGMETHSSTPLW